MGLHLCMSRAGFFPTRWGFFLGPPTVDFLSADSLSVNMGGLCVVCGLIVVFAIGGDECGTALVHISGRFPTRLGFSWPGYTRTVDSLCAA